MDEKQKEVNEAFAIIGELGWNCAIGCLPIECDLLLKLAKEIVTLRKKVKELERIV